MFYQPPLNNVNVVPYAGTVSSSQSQMAQNQLSLSHLMDQKLNLFSPYFFLTVYTDIDHAQGVIIILVMICLEQKLFPLTVSCIMNMCLVDSLLRVHNLRRKDTLENNHAKLSFSAYGVGKTQFSQLLNPFEFIVSEASKNSQGFHFFFLETFCCWFFHFLCLLST